MAEDDREKSLENGGFSVGGPEDFLGLDEHDCKVLKLKELLHDIELSVTNRIEDDNLPDNPIMEAYHTLQLLARDLYFGRAGEIQERLQGVVEMLLLAYLNEEPVDSDS